MHENQKLYASPQRGRREKWSVQLIETVENGQTVRFVHVDDLDLECNTCMPILTRGGTGMLWNTSDLDTFDNRFWVCDAAGQKVLGSKSMSQYMTPQQEPSDSCIQWRFIDASKAPDYPPGYDDKLGIEGDGYQGDGSDNGVFGDSDFESGQYYLLNWSTQMYLGVDESTCLQTDDRLVPTRNLLQW